MADRFIDDPIIDPTRARIDLGHAVDTLHEGTGVGAAVAP